MNFGEAITKYSDTDNYIRRRRPVIWWILHDPNSDRRNGRIAIMEKEVRSRMGMTATDGFNWNDIDWLKVVEWIGAILGIIMLFV